ncbi:MAG: palindromic element RPE1 domain-containing protein [Holosporales bacterium]|jgi:RPE1 domain-containing protein|nr:palindromic element RPE1 domain-containing protein [Holosporales bacterium]
MTKYNNTAVTGPLSKLSKSEFWEGDTEHRSGAYLDVREHLSTGSTYPKTDFEGFERGPFKLTISI